MEVKRKSIKKKKINVEYKKIDNINCLIFTLHKPFYQVMIGATKSFSFCEVEDLTNKINSIFYNSTREYVYCLEDEIITELSKIEK